MNYQQTVDYLYSILPAFQKSGKKALRYNFENIVALCQELENPQNSFKCIHIAGTNGKGSSSHMLASVLQEAGYKTGLYTSPHLKDFRERFRINGKMIPKNYVTNFVKKLKPIIKQVQPSFFEVSVAIAFKYFADSEVDIAVIEVGLGGRLDSTNIIIPILSLITNIGFDHKEILGDTLEKIAYEKAGIIKPNIPVVISESIPETHSVFKNIAKERNALLFFAEDSFQVIGSINNKKTTSYLVNNFKTQEIREIKLDLNGKYQSKNLIGVLKCIDTLNYNNNFNISTAAIKNGLKNVVHNTGLKGRWQVLSYEPLTVCDTGHNEHAFKYLSEKIMQFKSGKVHLILGFVKDKDVASFIKSINSEINIVFCIINTVRGMSIDDYRSLANIIGRNVNIYSNVNHAISEIQVSAEPQDFIFVGGSTYLVAEINNL